MHVRERLSFWQGTAEMKALVFKEVCVSLRLDAAP